MAQNLPKDFAKTAQNLRAHIICWIWMQQGRKAGSKKWIIFQHIQVIQHQQLCIFVNFFVFQMYTVQRFDTMNNFQCILSRCLRFLSQTFRQPSANKKGNINKNIKYQIAFARLIVGERNEYPLLRNESCHQTICCLTNKDLLQLFHICQLLLPGGDRKTFFYVST